MDDVHLVDYDPDWPSQYAAEVTALRVALPASLVCGMEHFGSTAIPGMIAKPIIDILVAVRSVDEARDVAVVPMEALGYAYWTDNPKADRLFFVKGLPPSSPHRTHHVHIVELDSEMWRRLIFRDYLIAHPEEGKRYAALKRNLAQSHFEDRETYTASKSLTHN